MKLSKLVQIVLLFLISVTLFSDVNAACYNDCEPLPDCAQMGYKLAEEIYCPDGAITCPFDSRYKWCKEYKCEDGRYSDNETLTGERGFRCDAVEYHKRQCYYCRCDPDPNECKWSNLNKGYGEISDGCCDGHFATCKNLCQDTVEVPEHAHGLKESCTGCGETKDIITSWECNDWYDRMGDKCYARPCPDGYSITAPDVKSCGKQGLGDAGWTWDSKDFSGENICGRCTAKTCLSGFSTDYPKVENCGKTGANGWDWKKSEQYAGDDICGKCTEKQCPDGFTSGVASVANCGSQGDAGWQYEQSSTFNGDTACGKCTPKQCPANSAVDVKDCGKTGGAGYSLGAHAGWNGESECKTCVPLTCNTGTATTEAGCGDTGNKGWSLGSETGRYNGDTACKNCQKLNCPADSKTEWSDATKCGSNGKMDGWTSSGIDHYNGETQCFTCSKKKCADGYNTNKPSVTSCGQSGASGWDWEGKGYSGDDVCGKCTAKACTGFDLLKCPEHGTCKECQSGDTKKYKLESCAHGWHPENNVCVEDPCEGYNLTQCPANGQCTQCQKGATTMHRLDKCNNGWNKVNDTCVMNECKDYAPSAATCGNSTCGASGWTVNNNDTCQKGATQTYKCVKSACPSNESTTYSDVSKCGTQGSKGWTSSATNSCNGDVKCYKCTKKPCESGYDIQHQNVDSCGSKGSTGWNWKQSSGYNGDEICGKCEAKPCAQGFSTDKPNEKSCGTVGGWTWSQSGYSGDDVCGKCEPKNCPNGEDTDSNVSTCGKTPAGWTKNPTGNYAGDAACYKCEPKKCGANESTDSTTTPCGAGGDKGWNREKTSNYNGDNPCYICTAKGCPQGESTSSAASTCGSASDKGWTRVLTGNYAGNTACYKCQAKVCPSGYETKYQSVSNCGNKGAQGWSFSTSNTGSAGETKCGKCEKLPCDTDYNTSNNVSDCKYPTTKYAKKTPSTTRFNGDDTCYKCVCEATDTNCPWTDSNKGTANISEQCCNGKYETCVSTCQGKSIPDNATCKKDAWCTGCGDTVCTDWACNDGWTLSNGACAENACNGYTISGSCPTNGQCDTCKKGAMTMYKLTGCNDGWQVSGNTCVEKPCTGYATTEAGCGSTGTNGWTLNKSNSCKKGSTTTYLCVAKTCGTKVEPPANAKCSEECTTGNEKRCVKWSCNQGYTSNGTSCNVSTCPNGSATTTAGCGKQASGWTLGNNNGSYSGANPCKTCTKKNCTSGDTNSAVNSCGYLGTVGASKSANGAYSGDDACYSCSCSAPTTCKWDDSNKGEGTLSVPCCNSKYQTCTTKCVTKNPPTHGHCTKECTGCGSKVCTAWDCDTGYTKSGNTCTPATCPTGYNTQYQTASDCPNGGTGWSVSFSGQSGATKCGKCTCNAASNCTWDNTNKGNATLDSLCCNGKYAKCTSTCAAAKTPPTHASCSSYCKGCNNAQVCVAWTCNSGYVESNGSCVLHDSGCTENAAPTNATCQSYCYSYGKSVCKTWSCNTGYTKSGSSCSVASCPNGSDTSSSTSNCYSGKYGAKKTANGSYSGSNQCYTCSCSASDCTWNSSNKGANGTLSTECCNGNYKSCTKPSAVSVPTNGYCSSHYTACGDTSICSGWACNTGYQKNSAGTGCDVKPCASGYATAVSGCGTSGGWTLGTATNGQSGASTCKQCVANTCSGYSLSSCPSNGSCTSCQKGNSKVYKLDSCSSGYTKNSAGTACEANACTGYSLNTCPANGSCSSCKKGTSTVYRLDSCNQGYTASGSTCKVADCPSGSATSTSGCGTHSTGWTLGSVTGYSGSNQCKKCEAKACPTGEDKDTSATNCGTKGAAGYVKNASGNYSGNSTCYKCVARSCPTGESTSSSGAGCGTTGADGWTRVASSNYAGETQCYKCKEKTCNSGYSTTYQDVDDCLGVCSDYSFNGYAGESKCGKCTITPTVFVPKNASCSVHKLCDKGSACSAWECNSGYTKTFDGTGCERALVAQTCTKCTAGYYECTKQMLGGLTQIQCSTSQMSGYSCVKCKTSLVDPTPTTGCPTGYATQLSGCVASINQTCTLNTSKSSGSSNGKPCYKCECTTSGGTSCCDRGYQCMCGTKCSNTCTIDCIYCAITTPVKPLLP